jgi:hypothetical protein
MKFERAIAFGCELIRIPSLSGEEGAVAKRVVDELKLLKFDIESQFGIQARLGEYRWERCRSVEEAVEFHRELIRDHNRLPHWAHHRRNDGKHAPLAVLGDARGMRVEPADLQRAFGQRYSQRLTDARGFVRIGRWKIYVEEGLPRTPVQLSYWDGRSMCF